LQFLKAVLILIKPLLFLQEHHRLVEVQNSVIEQKVANLEGHQRSLDFFLGPSHLPIRHESSDSLRALPSEHESFAQENAHP
jgi:hypothetical protein